MSVITHVPEANLWDTICKDISSREAADDDDAASVHTDYQDYDPAQNTPVFFGRMHAPANGEENASRELDPASSHPACAGYTFVDKPPASPPPPPRQLPDRTAFPPREFLENYVFPTLLPALEDMLRKAKDEKCFERKRTRFNALDFLTEYLYQKNPGSAANEREKTDLLNIPFVKEWLVDHPRPPLPKSLIWTDEEAALKIQSFYRGYRARLDPDIQELRKWQKEWREENRGIRSKVQEFWADKMPAADTVTPNASEEVLAGVPNKPISVKSPAPQNSS